MLAGCLTRYRDISVLTGFFAMLPESITAMILNRPLMTGSLSQVR